MCNESKHDYRSNIPNDYCSKVEYYNRKVEYYNDYQNENVE